MLFWGGNLILQIFTLQLKFLRLSHLWYCWQKHCVTMCIQYLIYSWILNNGYIIPENKLLGRTELDTKKRQTTIRWKKSPFFKKTLLSQIHICKKKNNKQTNPLLEDESHYKITFKHQDFCNELQKKGLSLPGVLTGCVMPWFRFFLIQRQKKMRQMNTTPLHGFKINLKPAS